MKKSSIIKLLTQRSIYLILAAFVLGMVAEKQIIKSNLRINLENGKVNIVSGQPKTSKPKETTPNIDLAKIQEEVLPEKGYTFNFKWGNLGKRLVDDGVIDKVKLAKAVAGQETLPPEFEKYLDGSNQQVQLDLNNSQFWVDVLWGLGLANKNGILEKGPMVESGQTANFASTGGYTIGAKQPMDLYSKYSYISLTADQQKIVEEVASGVFRPCCGNSTAFPDCNHGMAALALVELMAAQDFSKDEIYKTVLAFNSFWFSQTYLDIAYHFNKNGRDFRSVPASEILSKTFSSAQGYQAIKRQIGTVDWPFLKSRGGSCGA